MARRLPAGDLLLLCYPIPRAISAVLGAVMLPHPARGAAVLCLRVRELAEARSRYGCQRINVLLRRECWRTSAKRASAPQSQTRAERRWPWQSGLQRLLPTGSATDQRVPKFLASGQPKAGLFANRTDKSAFSSRSNQLTRLRGEGPLKRPASNLPNTGIGVVLCRCHYFGDQLEFRRDVLDVTPKQGIGQRIRDGTRVLLVHQLEMAA